MTKSARTQVREAMERLDTYNDCVTALSQGALLSPVYFIVAGTKKGEGIGITRRSGVSHLRHQDLKKGNTVVQCNTDWWKSDPLIDMMESKYRKNKAKELISTLCNMFEVQPLMEGNHHDDPTRHANEKGALNPYWDFVSTRPIRNDITVYACVMCPGASIFSARCNAKMPILSGKRVRDKAYLRPDCLKGDASNPLSS